MKNLVFLFLLICTGSTYAQQTIQSYNSLEAKDSLTVHGKTITDISSDTLLGSSDKKIPTQKAVKTVTDKKYESLSKLGPNLIVFKTSNRADTLEFVGGVGNVGTVNSVNGIYPVNGNVTLPSDGGTGSVSQVNADWNAASGVAAILNKPTIPAAQVNADWNAASGAAAILNKPTIPAAIDTGSIDKRIIANASAITLKQNQLNGTGFVKASGTTVSYDNTSYVSDTSALHNNKVDKSTTIKINGVTKDLSGNQDWGTIGGSGGSSSDTSSNYVSNFGSNTNNGYTSSTPKQTIAASQSVINSKATATGLASLLLEAGGVYPEEFKPSANNIYVSSYNINDVSAGFKDKGMWPIMSGADVFNSGWTLAGGFSNTYTRSVTTTTTDEFSNLGQYSYLNVIAIDTALEKVRPFSARYYLLPVTSTALVESTPGSYYTGTSTVSPTTVYIHLPNNSNPNSNATYRIEVSTRNKAIDAFNGPASYKANASYVIERDYMAGYGGFSSGSNSKYDHVIMRNGGGHTAVIAGGTVGNSLVLGGAKGIVSGAIDFYSLSGIGGHNKIFNTIFLNIGGAVGAHTSGGINHGALEINNVFAWTDSTDSQNFVFANNTDTLLLNGVYTDHQSNILSNVGVAPNTIVKNSVFVNGTSFGNAPNNFVIDNVLFKAYSSGASSASNPLGPSLNANTKLRITNSIIHLKTYATTAQTQSFLNGTAATSSERVYSKYNIFIMDAPGGSAGGALTDNAGAVRDTFDYNVYIKVRGAIGFGTTVQGNNLTFLQWQTNSGQDVHSLYIDLTNEGSGLKAVFVDPDNGNYNLVQGGWGDSIRARQAGMLTPPAYFFSKPTQEQAVQMVMNDKIPTIQSLFLTGGIGQQGVTTQGNNFNGSSQLVQTTSTGKLPVLDGSNLTGVLASSAGTIDGQVQIKSGLNMGFSNNLRYDATNNRLAVGSSTNPTYALDVTGDIRASNSAIVGTDLILSNIGGNKKLTYPTNSNVSITDATNSTGGITFTGSTSVSGGSSLTTFTPFPNTLTFTKAGGLTTIQVPQFNNTTAQHFNINTGDYAFAGNQTLAGDVRLFAGKNTTNTVSGNTLIAYDGTTRRGSVAIGGNVVSGSIITTNTTTEGALVIPRLTTAQRDGMYKTLTASITNAGSGYTGTPTFTFSGGGGAGLVMTGSFTGGVLNSATITQQGYGYSSAPTVTVTGGSGTGAVVTLTATIPTWTQVVCTDCTATDGSTGVLQIYNGTTWKNAW